MKQCRKSDHAQHPQGRSRLLEASASHRLSWLAPISAWLENEAILGYVLMTPALLLIVVFIAYPFSLGVWLSLTDKLVGKPAQLHWPAQFYASL